MGFGSPAFIGVSSSGSTKRFCFNFNTTIALHRKVIGFSNGSISGLKIQFLKNEAKFP